MALLAIQGHPTRGKEVISLLEMLGGKNDRFKLEGLTENFIYYIYPEHNNNIYSAIIPTNQIVFTLEQFEEKFPYKVGDKVIYEDKRREITKMVWEEQTNTVAYKLDDKLYCNVINKLQPYKEETMEERQYKELRMPLDDDDKLATEVTIDGNKIQPPNGYLIGKITQVNNGFLVEYVKKQPQFPKTYEECCEILNIHPKPYFTYTWNIEETNVDIALTHHHDNLLNKLDNLRILLICRDAYWKIAGEQMGLGKPWEPDWNDENEFKYGLYHFRNGIMRDGSCINSTLLAFTTEEMRDVFYENFKDLIGTCKELL